jgi:hypothetical protein
MLGHLRKFSEAPPSSERERFIATEIILRHLKPAAPPQAS